MLLYVTTKPKPMLHISKTDNQINCFQNQVSWFEYQVQTKYFGFIARLKQVRCFEYLM